MIASGILSILVGLAVLRRAIEPACPACSSKRWGADTAHPLSCDECGWSAASTGAVDTEPQYEISFR